MLRWILLILSIVLFQNCANKKRGVLLPLIPLVQETSSPSQKSSNPSPISNTTNDVSNTNNNNDTPPPPPPPVLVQFQTTSSSATEGTDQSVSIVVTLSSHLDTVVSVDYQVSGGTASSPSDYTLSTTTTLTFNPGETQKSFTVTIIDNQDHVPMSRTVIFTLTNLSPALSLGTNSTHTLTIHEDINDVP